ncbi:hypothetical protein ABW20_dc0102837 [Dactylellina cionopaga]|nr:hypothetical protein ABW20_dc0102837 [Dactylellina cionopaga]
MASHRPKRKSATKTFLEDTADDVRRDNLPPLKKTRRSSPRRNMNWADDTIPKAQTRATRSIADSPITRSGNDPRLTSTAGSIFESDDSTGGIFSKGPSRAKKAKQSQRDREERQKKEHETLTQQSNLSGLRSADKSSRGSPSKSRQHPTIQPESSSQINNLENERPVPAHSNARQPAASRKSRVHLFETPGRHAPKVRRSPRLNVALVETSMDANLGNDRPVTVPLAAIEDTPLVRKRNKEMREAKGHRRSSLGLRGRRASSLTNGFIAAPHPDVHPSDFFKHVDAQMIETQRMQQLLAWCSKCALSERRARGRDAQSNARAAARVIEEDILADLTEKKLNVNWWEISEVRAYGDSYVLLSLPMENSEQVPKKPHPKNEDHKRKIADLEQQLQKLTHEKEAWVEIYEKGPFKLSKPQEEDIIRPGSLDTTLLRPNEISVIPGFEESDKAISAIQDVVSKGRGAVEFKIDQFSHGMHKAQEYSRYAKNVSEKVLAKASSVLDMRQEATKKAAGTTELPLHEVLKSISHLDRG